MNPDAHVPGKAKEGTNIGKVLAVGPVTNSCNFGVVRDAALVVALVPQDDYFWDGNEQFLRQDSGSSAA